jgi:23S rRNA pseudouridine1911/1915/1917 synthase
MSSTEPTAAVEVLHEDTHFAIVSKPAGMAAQADSTGDVHLLAELGRRWPLHAAALRPVNRLDRPVSGCMVVAWTADMAAQLSALFAAGQVAKTYWAIVEGHPPEESVLEHRIARDARNRRAVASAEQGRMVRTRYTRLQQGERYALLEVVPEGGAFHQIRFQLAAAGHPIRGDVKYGARRAERGPAARTIALHARSLRFLHPVTGEALEVVADPPAHGLWARLAFP